MGNSFLRSPSGEQARLGDLAQVKVTRGAEVINREEGQRRIVVMSNVRGRDLGSFVAEVRRKIEGGVTFQRDTRSCMADNLKIWSGQLEGWF